MVLQVPETLGVAGVGISRVDVCANDWVLEIFAVHLCQIGVLRRTYEAQCAVELVVIGCRYCKNVVVRHVAGDAVHGSFG